jgi:hypothetical protein
LEFQDEVNVVLQNVSNLQISEAKNVNFDDEEKNEDDMPD